MNSFPIKETNQNNIINKQKTQTEKTKENNKTGKLKFPTVKPTTVLLTPVHHFCPKNCITVKINNWYR